jgi:hypothetical protein
MKALLIIAIAAVLPSAPTNVRLCGPAPALPEITELWPVQDPADDTRWTNYVTAWVPGESQCWVLGWALLDYEHDGDPDTPQIMEPVGPGDLEYVN